MSTKIEKTSKAVLVDTRCRYVSSSGRRCRGLAARDTSRASGISDFCVAHSQMEQQYINTKPVADELLGGMDNFRSAVAINDVLGRLFVLQAQNRIPVRNAMALAYTAQVILSSLETVCDEVVRAEGRSTHNQLIHVAFHKACSRQEAQEAEQEAEEETEEEEVQNELQINEEKNHKPENALDAAIRILQGS